MVDRERDSGQYADYREIQAQQATERHDQRTAIQSQGTSVRASSRKEIRAAQLRQLGGVSTSKDEHDARVKAAELDTRKP